MFKLFWTQVTAVGNFVASFFLLIIRLYWGYQLLMTGIGKLFHLSTVAAYFHSLDIPLPYLNALLAGSIEFLGGSLLFLGLFSRIAAIPLFFVLSIAYITASRAALSALISNLDPSLFFSDTAFLFIYAVLIIFCFGPGKISCDYWLTGANKTKTMP